MSRYHRRRSVTRALNDSITDLKIAQGARRKQRDITDALPERQLIIRNRIGMGFALLTLVGLTVVSQWLMPLGFVIVLGTQLGHAARWRRREEARRLALPSVNVEAERQRAVDLGWESSRRFWEAQP